MVDLTPKQIHILQHSLGISKPHDKPYRNFYAVYSDSDGIRDLELLVEKGLMINSGSSPVNSDMVYYQVSDAGRKVAFDQLPKDTRTRAQKRYEKYLDIRDVWSDLTFKEFLIDPYFKEARDAT
jgi:hypothetical protein